MGNIERIMMRDAISQMLADNGINRETLCDMIKDNIGDKVEKATARIFHDRHGGFDSIVREEVKKMIRQEVRDAVRDAVRMALAHTTISVVTRDAHFGGKDDDQ